MGVHPNNIPNFDICEDIFGVHAFYMVTFANKHCRIITYFQNRYKKCTSKLYLSTWESDKIGSIVPKNRQPIHGPGLGTLSVPAVCPSVDIYLCDNARLTILTILPDTTLS